RQAPSLALGVSPRGATRMLGAARAHAWLSGRNYVTPDDVKALTHMALGHRVILRPEAQMDGLDVAGDLDSILATAEVPRWMTARLFLLALTRLASAMLLPSRPTALIVAGVIVLNAHVDLFHVPRVHDLAMQP